MQFAHAWHRERTRPPLVAARLDFLIEVNGHVVPVTVFGDFRSERDVLDDNWAEVLDSPRDSF